nr:hypothetical protein [uncultured Pseudoxanthomonas sp.]
MTSDTLPDATPWIRLLRSLAWGGAAALLLLPWVAMQFTADVAWTASDFALFGAMLLIACLAFEAMARVARVPAYLAASVIAIGAAFLLVWANLAVGIVGEPEHPANLLFMGVLVMGGVGALLSGLRPRGMSITLATMAAMQALAGIATLMMGVHEPAAFVLVLTGICGAVWLLSAALFDKAAVQRTG